MALPINDTRPWVQYTASGGQTAFTVPFEFFANADLRVYNGSTLLSYNASPSSASQYSAMGASVDGGGSITLGSPGATAGDTITIFRDIAVERTADFPLSGPFQIESLNTELARVTGMVQQLEQRIEHRTLTLDQFDTPSTIGKLPAKATRASKFLGFDASGNPLALGGTDGTGGALAIALAATGGAALIGTPDGTAEDELAGIRTLRGVTTAAGLEARANAGEVQGVDGATHTVEASPYPTKVRIQGNGATIRNTNATELSAGDTSQRALPLGISTLNTTDDFTYYAISAVSGPLLTVGANASNFTVGDIVIMHGAASYAAPEGAVYRNYLRANVVAVGATTVMLDRALPKELIDDTPVIATTAEAVPSLVTGGPTNVYLLNAPRVENLTIKSDKGNTTWGGGCIDGVFRDVTCIGRSGPQLNAMQDCLFDGVRVQAWRKLFELAEGSVRTTARNVRGVLESSATKLGGASDGGVFFVGISENCAECVFEDFNVSSGPNDPGTGVSGVQIGSGRDNEIRDSFFDFPAHTGRAMAIQAAGAEAARANTRSGYRRDTVNAPVCSYFVAVTSTGATIDEPFIEDCTFRGTPTAAAAQLGGTNGRFLRNRFPSGSGAILLNGTPNPSGWRIEGNEADSLTIGGSATNCVIRGNYLRNGFNGLTEAMLKAHRIYGNESDASRRLDAAAYISTATASVTTTTPNSIYGSATFAAGDLAVGDIIHFRTEANASGSGTGTRSFRPSVLVNGVTTGILTFATSVATTVMSATGTIRITSDTGFTYDYAVGNTRVHGVVAGLASLAANALQFNLEFWTTADAINVRGGRIIPTKPGMAHLPLP